MPKSAIIAADFGGTKGEVLVVNAESGAVVRRVFETWHSVPPEIFAKLKEANSGMGRTRPMQEYCFDKALDGLPLESIHVAGNYSAMILENDKFRNIKCLNRLSVGEAQGVMLAEGIKTGICLLLGTGVNGEVFIDEKPVCLIDSLGMVCGDWGGADYIGFNFVRNVLREQMFSNAFLPETIEIYKGLCERLGEEFEFDFSNPPPVFKIRMAIVSNIAWRGNNISIISSISEICDESARRGSTIAKNVLEMAGREAAENIRRAAVFKGLDGMEQLPVVCGGSVFMHSDFVFEAFAGALREKLPNVEIIRTERTQTYGQVVRMLEMIHGAEKAPALIENFRKSLTEKQQQIP